MTDRIFDIAEKQKNDFPKQDALCGKEDGAWKAYSTDDLIRQANNVSYGLMSLGLKKDDKVALVSNNRPEWNFLDFGMLQIGIINVPLYLTLSESEFKFILNDAEVKYVFVSDESLFQKIQSIKKEVPSLVEIYTINKVSGAKHWSEVTTTGTRDEQKLQQIKREIKPTDLATILYTSGTTGVPKGVMLSHDNILSNVKATVHLLPFDHHGRALSFLPLCHSYERMLTYVYMYCGVSIYYAESTDKLMEHFKELHPDGFSTVPRLLEKVYDRIVEKGKDLSGIKKSLFFWALKLGLRYELNRTNGWWYETQLKLANKLIFSKWREALGGNVKVIISGGAALQPRLARIFWAARIHVLEGYGLTETSPVIAVNNFEPNSVMFGTVGPVIKEVSVKIAEDGEILCKGPNVMLGYYKRPDLTADTIRHGWFHTGDIGTLVQNRFLKITDRKKEMFKTSGGKYIAPQAIENKLKESLFIEQVMVIGENRKFPAALIVPSFSHVQKWCETKGIDFTTNEEAIRKPEIIERIKKEIAEFNKEFGQTERIKKFELLPKEWTIETGELTPTLKLKRKIILEKYNDLVEKIYS
jgi:long-chain acyl-CoA synthetase